MSRRLEYLALWKQGFVTDGGNAPHGYLDFERVKPGIDRLERVTLCLDDDTWYATARALDLNGDDVCPEWESGGYATAEEAAASLDTLPPEYGYHNHDSTPGDSL